MIYWLIEISSKCELRRAPKISINFGEAFDLECQFSELFYLFSLGSPGKDHHRFVDAVVLIAALGWSDELSNLENADETKFDPSLIPTAYYIFLNNS